MEIFSVVLDGDMVGVHEVVHPPLYNFNLSEFYLVTLKISSPSHADIHGKNGFPICDGKQAVVNGTTAYVWE